MKNFSQLDDSFWQYDYSQLTQANQQFLSRHKQSGRYEIQGLTFTCPGNIYQPHDLGSTRFCIRGLFSQLPRWGKKVLEIGTGSGAVGICLAAAGLDVTLVDIDPLAVESAKQNAQFNQIEVDIYQSDLFAAVPFQHYDSIFFNIPLLDKLIEEPLEQISCDPAGHLFGRFMTEAKDYLRPGGQLCISAANIGNREAILAALQGYDDDIIYAEFYALTQAWRWLLALKPHG